jgi:molybdate transport system substrate-binding protein
MRKASLAIAAAIAFVLLVLTQDRLTSYAAAQNAPVRVLVSNGMKAVLEDLQPQVERTIGHPLAMTFESTAVLKRKMDAGEAFDVAVLTSEVTSDLIKEGKLMGATRADLARAGIGVGIRKGAPKPDIRTADAMKKTLLEAKSITYASEGASRPYIDKMIDRLGIAAELKPKIKLTNGSGPATESVAKGNSTLVLTLISEELPVPGLEVAGPVPAEFQSYINFSAAAGAKAGNPDAAKALIAFLKSPKAMPTYKTKGMEAISQTQAKGH